MSSEPARAKRQRGQKVSDRMRRQAWLWCEQHAKQAYASRKAAKEAIRAMPQDAKAMREYPCTAMEGRWHVGHMSKDVVRGRRSYDVMRRDPVSVLEEETRNDA